MLTYIPWRSLYMLLVMIMTGFFSEILAETKHFEAEWPKTNFSARLVELHEILSGGPPKDGIPAIDKPKFVDTKIANSWLHEQEPVIVVNLHNEVRAYPLQILMFHEIVNDVIAGTPIVVTFCPLCNASIVFSRTVQGKVLNFGTTGRLRKSDLVMYDRQTESWWQQFIGTAIIGDYAGTTLTQIASQIVAYEDFKAQFPQAQVLSRDTGFQRQYGRNPYQGYDRVGNVPFLFTDPTDPRLPAMERVLSVEIADQYRIYPFALLDEQPVINDVFNQVDIVIFSKQGTLSVLDKATIRQARRIPSAVAFKASAGDRKLTFHVKNNTIFDEQTHSQWSILGKAIAGPLKNLQLTPIEKSGVHFAFAWLAFNPKSDIYTLPRN